MKDKIDFKSMALGLFLGGTIVFSLAATTTTRSSTTWEYKVLQRNGQAINYEPEFNKLGQEGWELTSDAISHDPGLAENHTIIFRRAR